MKQLSKPMTPRIEKAIDILLDALNNGHLIAGDCTCCAVGTLIREGMGYDLKAILYKNKPEWVDSEGIIITTWWGTVFSTGKYGQRYYITDHYEEAYAQFAATDFTINELAQIEEAFELNTVFTWHDTVSEAERREDLIKGLDAVVEVMMSFDDVKEDTKEVFTNKAQSVLQTQ